MHAANGNGDSSVLFCSVPALALAEVQGLRQQPETNSPSRRVDGLSAKMQHVIMAGENVLMHAAIAGDVKTLGQVIVFCLIKTNSRNMYTTQSI